ELERLIDVAAGTQVPEVVMTFTDRPSELAGALEDAAGRPATDFFVVAFPTERALWTTASRRIRTTRPGTDGAFSLKGLPAGDYFLAAITDVEPGEWL